MEHTLKDKIKLAEDEMIEEKLKELEVKKEGSIIMKSLWMILIILFFYNAITFGLNTFTDDLVIKHMVINIGWMVIAIGMILILKTKELK